MQFEITRDPHRVEVVRPPLAQMDLSIAAREAVIVDLYQAAAAEEDEAKRAEMQAEIDEQEADLVEFKTERDALAERDDLPEVTIRLIPPQKMSAMRREMSRLKVDGLAFGKAPGDRTDDEAEALLVYDEAIEDLERETLRWGVVGWEFEIDEDQVNIEMGEEMFKGRTFEVLSHDAVDTLDLLGWRHALSMAIWDLNTLKAEQRKK